MPRGVPVVTVAIGKAGAANAGILAAQIVALSEPEVAARLQQYKADLAAKVEREFSDMAVWWPIPQTQYTVWPSTL
jgi:phosphoribosylcarboxyaminoimidazole (NCAIR) mutase